MDAGKRYGDRGIEFRCWLCFTFWLVCDPQWLAEINYKLESVSHVRDSIWIVLHRDLVAFFPLISLESARNLSHYTKRIIGSIPSYCIRAVARDVIRLLLLHGWALLWIHIASFIRNIFLQRFYLFQDW